MLLKESLEGFLRVTGKKSERIPEGWFQKISREVHDPTCGRISEDLLGSPLEELPEAMGNFLEKFLTKRLKESLEKFLKRTLTELQQKIRIYQ